MKTPTKQPALWWLIPLALLAVALAGLFLFSVPSQTGTSQEWLDNARILKAYLLRTPTREELQETYDLRQLGAGPGDKE